MYWDQHCKTESLGKVKRKGKVHVAMRPSSVNELALLSIYPSRSDKTFSFGF
ncbi:hypothetical protein PAHAL_2G359500 [Panicum hallii]|uniref:Uncharacterized protein n=1 Tax=Panicum hallii TaxID=206008 RepID=A0A2T8KRQ2_9POAL|nr:hypothetical protein PAHAL_2G359500 [Panicum hallii]